MPDGEGECTPPAVSRKSQPGPAEAAREQLARMRERSAVSDGACWSVGVSGVIHHQGECKESDMARVDRIEICKGYM